MFVCGSEELRYIEIIRIVFGEIGDIEMIRDRSLVRVMRRYITCTGPYPARDQSCFQVEALRQVSRASALVKVSVKHPRRSQAIVYIFFWDTSLLIAALV